MEMTYNYIPKDILNYLIVLSGFFIGFCLLYMKETLNENVSDVIPELKDKNRFILHFLCSSTVHLLVS